MASKTFWLEEMRKPSRLRVWWMKLTQPFKRWKTKELDMTTDPRVKDWLYDNVEYCKGVLEDAEKEKIFNLQVYPLFVDEINSDFASFCKTKIAIEVSTAIGCSTEAVVDALEEIGLEKFR